MDSLASLTNDGYRCLPTGRIVHHGQPCQASATSIPAPPFSNTACSQIRTGSTLTSKQQYNPLDIFDFSVKATWHGYVPNIHHPRNLNPTPSSLSSQCSATSAALAAHHHPSLLQKPNPNMFLLPLSRDPILRSFQQTQAVSHEDPEFSNTVYEETRPKPSQSKRHTPSHSPQEREHHAVASQRAQSVKQDYRDPSPPPPPPPPLPLARPRPRVASYERPKPVETVREKYTPRPVDYPSYQERMASRAVSARWASATAALDIR